MYMCNAHHHQSVIPPCAHWTHIVTITSTANPACITLILSALLHHCRLLIASLPPADWRFALRRCFNREIRLHDTRRAHPYTSMIVRRSPCVISNKRIAPPQSTSSPFSGSANRRFNAHWPNNFFCLSTTSCPYLENPQYVVLRG